MKTRIEEAFLKFWESCTHDFDFDELGKRDAQYIFNHAFEVGAEFMQKEAEFWETFVKGLTKDLIFHQNLNKEKIKECAKLKAQNDLMAKALRFYINYSDDSEVAYDALEKVGEV